MGELFKLDKLDIGHDKKIVNNISLTVNEKELICFLSPNNCGKTTLIETLSGVIVAKDGSIIYDGKIVTKSNFKKYIRNVGVVFEDINNQYICEKVDDELKFPLIHLSYKYRDIINRVDEVSKVLGLEDRLDKNIRDLTLLERAKVAIGVAIMHSPKILFVDDIFKQLNPKDKEVIMDIFKLLIVNYNMSIIFTTSDLADCYGLNRIYVIGNNKISFHGSYDLIVNNDNELSKLGIEIPIMVDLSRKLQFYGLVDEIYYDIDKVVDALWK